MRALTFSITLGTLGLVLLGSGCGGHSTAPVGEPHPVAGKVTFADKTPLVGGVVYFIPVDVNVNGKLRYKAAGLVDTKGHYKLGFNNDNKGAVPGEYKVTIEPRDGAELANSNSSRIAKIYQDEKNTPLTATVKEGDNSFDFTIK
jgi:hypothetical protein